MWIEPVAYLSKRKICACVKWVSVISRLSCRMFNSAFGEIRLSDKFGLRLNFGLRHALFLIFYLNEIRNFYYFLVKTCFHHNICHHQIHRKFFKISFFALRGKKYLQNWSSPVDQSEDKFPRVQDINLSGRTISKGNTIRSIPSRVEGEPLNLVPQSGELSFILSNVRSLLPKVE